MHSSAESCCTNKEPGKTENTFGNKFLLIKLFRLIFPTSFKENIHLLKCQFSEMWANRYLQVKQL